MKGEIIGEIKNYQVQEFEELYNQLDDEGKAKINRAIDILYRSQQIDRRSKDDN